MLHFGQNYVEKSTYLEIPGNSRREFEDCDSREREFPVALLQTINNGSIAVARTGVAPAANDEWRPRASLHTTVEFHGFYGAIVWNLL